MLARIAVFARAWRDDAVEWCEGRRWELRAALLVYLAYAGARHVADPLYKSWFAGVTLAIHEIGHVAFSPFGDTMHVLGGSLAQLIAPAAAGAYLLFSQRDHFGFAVCGAWLSFSTWELATYVGDASHEALPLVGFGTNVEHDWATLLTRWHLLNDDAAIAGALRLAAFVLWAASITLGGWLCVTMARPNRAGTP